MPTPLPPLRFRPIIRDYIWGGRRLATDLDKPIGSLERAAESWEVVDHGNDQSIVADGPLVGRSLHELVSEFGPGLFGGSATQKQFPLLLKFLDCAKTLSVQVHPNDAQAAKLSPPDLGKTEAWVVLAAEPGSLIYAGLKPGVDRATLEGETKRGTCDKCLHSFTPQLGDCVLIEAGTVHALGAGLLVAEIQQASDTTYRLFDWNRVDRDGKPRELHVERALDTIDFSRGPVAPVRPRALAERDGERLVACDKFILDRRHLSASRALARDDRFHIVTLIKGRASLASTGNNQQLERGDTVLVPASAQGVEIESSGSATLLDMYLP